MQFDNSKAFDVSLNNYFCEEIREKGTLFRNIQNTGRLYYSALGSRRVLSIGWVLMS